ncbi:hypothetical protein AU374_01428 [Cupriavidus metallidurans]|nr:hypothetical protein AU374_01428 [Cupriavidus metallidurans]
MDTSTTDAEKIGNGRHVPRTVPDALKAIPGWLVWKFKPDPKRPGKPRKVPYYAESRTTRGDHGTALDRAQLVTFDEAQAAALRHQFDGVGLATLPEWGITALDFDDCVDAAGNVHPEVENCIAGTYAEFSPSGSGVRAFVVGALPNRKSHAGAEHFGFETFHGSGYVTVTGRALDICELLGTENTIGEISEDVRALWEQRFGGRAEATNQIDTSAHGDLERLATLAAITDETMADLHAAMAVFSEQDADDYRFWAEQMGLALKSLAQAGRGDEALAMWHEFSARSPRYDFDQADEKWGSFDPSRITYRSIFEWATARGWVNPRSAEALKANATAATRLDRTDAGNVALLATVVDGALRYVPERRVWLSWDGQRWEPDSYGSAAQSAALQVAEHYHRKAAEIRKQGKAATLDDKERKRIDQAAENVEKWATHCRNKRAIDNMLNLAKGDARFTLPVAELDRDVWLFGVDNGVVDLRTGALRNAARDDYVTRRSPARFDPTATAPRWLQFIEEITAEPTGGAGQYRARPALAAYMQRALGYALTGSTGEHKMFIAIGEGSNGKNVLLDLLQWIMGGYCETIAPEALMASRHDADAERPTPSARKLAGARAAISSESKDGQRLDVALVKRHTGGGYMTARGLHENTFTFEITHKLWLMTNHRPALDHMDEAMRGRLHLIPFDMRWNRPGHPDRDPTLPDGDKALPEKLKAEADGILAWLVAGAVAYAQEGLEPPHEVVRMTRAYFKDQDPLGLWLDTCEACDAKQGALASELFDAFCGWADEEGYDGSGSWSQTAFSKKLTARGIVGLKTKTGKRYALRVRSTEG